MTTEAKNIDTSEEQNRKLFSLLYPDKCWHEWGTEYACSLCGKNALTVDGIRNPDYCSDHSPRSLIDEAERMVIERVGRERYTDHLAFEFLKGDRAGTVPTAPASVRVAAMIAAMEKV